MTKYPQGYKTKRDFFYAVKQAPINATFFSPETMRFFGKQHFDVTQDGMFLEIRFLEKCPRTSYYRIDPETLQVSPTNRLAQEAMQEATEP